jgi:O-antigen/teichoic acid export membrane protein
MKAIIQKFFKQELIKGSAIVLVGSVASNFLNYLYHPIVSRFLGPEGYAVIASLLALFYVVSFPTAIIGISYTRKIAVLAGKKDMGAIRGYLLHGFKWIAGISIMLNIGIFMIKDAVAAYLHIEQPVLILALGMTLTASFFGVIGGATIQGLMRMKWFSAIAVLGALLRDAWAIIPILFGLGVVGVMWGYFVSIVIGIFITLIPLRDIITTTKRTVVSFSTRSFRSHIWVMYGLLGMSALTNVDLVLVKHYFPAYDAGLYAALSSLGKVVFFAPGAVLAMFLPLVARKRAEGQDVSKDMLMAQVIMITMSLGIISLYLLFPKFIMGLLYGSEYVSASHYAWLFGTYYMFYNSANVFVSFYISTHRTRILLIPVVGALAQIGLIIMNHTSFVQIISQMIGVEIVFVAVLTYYYIRTEVLPKTAYVKATH